MTDFDALLRAALQEQIREAGPSSVGLASIESMVAGRREFERIYAIETGPEQVRLDLHLEGPNVVRNATRADWFSRFLSSLEAAVDATAHHLAGKGKRLPDLLVTGALPGSVRVVLQVPDAARPSRVGSTPEMVDSSTVLSQAVRTVAGALVAAGVEDSPDNDTLIAAVETMPKTAKLRLSTLARTVDRADWEIRGNISQRHREPEEFRVSQRGIRRLASALKAEISEPERVTVIGRIDGVRYSLSTLWLIPNEGTRTVAVMVPSAELLDEAAALNASHALVRVQLDVYRAISPDGAMVSASRSLVSIVAEPEPIEAVQTPAF